MVGGPKLSDGPSLQTNVTVESSVVGVHLIGTSCPPPTLSPALGYVIGFSCCAKTVAARVERATKVTVIKRMLIIFRGCFVVVVVMY